MLRREHSLFSRRVLIAIILALCTIFLCLWQLPTRKSFLLQPDPSSDSIYDLFIEGSPSNDPPKDHEPPLKSNSSELPPNHPDEGYVRRLLLANPFTEDGYVQ